MTAHALLFARESTAARLLDMKPAEFRALVETGSLPPPCRLEDVERWDVEQLQAIVRGKAAKPSEEFDP